MSIADQNLERQLHECHEHLETAYGYVDDGRLHVDPEEFLNVRHALERAANGVSKRQVAEHSGIPQSTLTNLCNDEERRQMYLEGNHEDDKIDSATGELGPLPELGIDEDRQGGETNSRNRPRRTLDQFLLRGKKGSQAEWSLF